MPKTIILPFEGQFKHSQSFGARPQAYARFGIKGHDGDDWLMPVKTKIVSPVNGLIQKVGYDANGWGRYLHVWDKRQNLLINLAHLDSTSVHKGDVVQAGKEIARSGNTGNSSAPHLHAAAADTGADGKKLNTGNGFRGWYSILDPARLQVSAGAPDVSRPANNPDQKVMLSFERWMSEISRKLDQIIANTKA